jgi:YD repeat-containing protein
MINPKIKAMKSIRYFLFSLLFFTFLSANAQQGSSSYDPLPKLLPATPEAASIQRYGETEINLFKGEPGISIPLYTLAGGKLSMPLSLSYNAGGFRVGELSTCTGLGWNLNGGGMITRNIRGQSDFKDNGRKTPDLRTFNPSFDSRPADYLLARNILDYNYDTEPDIFSYNLPTQSGKFMFDDSLKNIYTIPYQKIKIDRLPGTDGFIITDGSGIQYFFTIKELNNISESCELGSPGQKELGGSQPVNWLLTKIKHPAGDSIVLSYEDYTLRYREGVSEIRYKYLPSSQCAGNSGDFISKERKCTRVLWLSGKRLKKISMPGTGEVELYYNTLRQDVDYYAENSNARSLDSIVARNNSNTVRKFSFGYGYFQSDGMANAVANDVPLYKRLKLNTLTEEGRGSYTFNYNTATNLPQRLSSSQDVLGYCNGTSPITRSMIPCVNGGGYAGCSLRDVDSRYLDANLITNIRYPTGGVSKFYFEPHRRTYYKYVYDTAFGGVGIDANPETIVTDSVVLNASTDNYLSVNWSLPCVNDRLVGCSRGSVKLPNGKRIQLDSIGESGNIILDRQPGKYILRISNSQQFVSSANISMVWVDSVTRRKLKAMQYSSGVRIKQVIDSAGFNAPEVKKLYVYENPADSLEYFTDHRSANFTNYIETRACIPDYANLKYCNYIQYNGQSVSPYGIENDYQYGYQYVSVHYDTLNNTRRGREDYIFATQENDMDSIGLYSEYLHFGKLLSKKEMRFDGVQNKFIPYQEESNRYTFLIDEQDFWGQNTVPRFTNRGEKFIAGLQLQMTYPEITGGCIATASPSPVIPAEYAANSYVRTSFINFPSGNTVSLYPIGGGLIKKSTTVYYDNPVHALPTRTVTVNSTGDSLITLLKYIDDYPIVATSDPVVEAMNNLRTKNIVNTPVEKISLLKKPDGTQYIVSATLTTYKTGQPFPDKLYNMELSEPLLYSQFQQSSVSVSGIFFKDSRYREQASFGNYDAKGNILQMQKTNDLPVAYIWDYNGQLPIAEIKGATAAQVAYTSFEADGSGNWSITATARNSNTAITGTKSYELSSGNISLTSLPTGTKYIVSAWLKNGNATVNGAAPTISYTRNGWTYCQYELPVTANSVTISGTATIDELRLYPKDAAMVSFTHIPLIGISGACDATNKIIYYEYDGLGRLASIRDQDKNILKLFDYQYQVNSNQ